jgi:hypothetical protein
MDFGIDFMAKGRRFSGGPSSVGGQDCGGSGKWIGQLKLLAA